MPTGVYPRTKQACSVVACDKPHLANGYCSGHNYSFKKYGDPLTSSQNKPQATRDPKALLVCLTCEKKAPAEEFRFRKDRDAYERTCLECLAKSSVEWRANNTERSRQAARRAKALKNYGEDALPILERMDAGDPCDACGQVRSRMVVDHCHDTCRVRGLLCSNCNTALGLLAEDPDRMFDLIAYMSKKD